MNPIPVLLVAVVVILGLKTAWDRRARRRNEQRRCARCGGKLPYDEQYRVEGLLHCPRCAKRVRRSMHLATWTLIGLVGLGVLAALLGLVSDWQRGHGFAFPILVFIVIAWLIGGAVLLWRSAVQQARWANEFAQSVDKLRPPSEQEIAAVREALARSGLPECEWVERFTAALDQERSLRREAKFIRQVEDHKQACELCRARRAVVETARERFAFGELDFGSL